MKMRRSPSHTPLFFFVEHAPLSDLKEIFPYVENVNESCNDLDRNTPLTLAVRCDRSDVVKFLLDNGADINVCKETPTYIALVNNNCGLFDLLLRYNPDIDLKGPPPTNRLPSTNPNRTRCSVYRRAMDVRYGGVLILRSLVEHLISRDQMDTTVATDCFPKVVLTNDLVLIHTLLEYKINMDVIDATGRMPEIRSDEMAAILACEGYILTPMRMLRSIDIDAQSWNTIKIFVALGLEICNFVGLKSVTYQDMMYRTYELILSCSPSTSETSEHISALLSGLLMKRSLISRRYDLVKIDTLRSLLLSYNPSSIDHRDFELVPSLRKKAIQSLRSMKLREEIEELRVCIEHARISKDWQSLLK
jgi:hypothetical protein